MCFIPANPDFTVSGRCIWFLQWPDRLKSTGLLSEVDRIKLGPLQIVRMVYARFIIKIGLSLNPSVHTSIQALNKSS